MRSLAADMMHVHTVIRVARVALLGGIMMLVLVLMLVALKFKPVLYQTFTFMAAPQHRAMRREEKLLY